MPENIRPYLHLQPQIGKRVYIDPAATVIGRTQLADDVSIWPNVVVRGDVEAISIGAGTNIQDNAVLHVTHKGPLSPLGGPLQIGKGVTVGHSAILHACTIGDYCLIGMGAIVLDGAIVEPFSLLAAGAVLAPGKRIESGWLWRGNPAKPARELSVAEKEYFKYSADHYINLKDQYLQQAAEAGTD